MRNLKNKKLLNYLDDGLNYKSANLGMSAATWQILQLLGGVTWRGARFSKFFFSLLYTGPDYTN